MIIQLPPSDSEHGLIDMPAQPLRDRAFVPWLVRPQAPPMDMRAAAFDALPLPALLVESGGAIVACNAAMVSQSGLQAAAMLRCPWWSIVTLGHSVTRDQSRGTVRGAVLHGVQGDSEVWVRMSQFAYGQEVATLLVLEPPAEAASPSVPELPVEATPSMPDDMSFLLDVVHELRSPLFSFNLALGAMTERGAAEEQRLVQTLRRSAVHMQTLVENMLDAAGIDANGLRVTLDEIDLAAVVTEAALVVEPLLEPNGQHLDLRVSDGLIVHADAHRLRQVLVNLLHNATKYGPRRAAIGVRAERRSAAVLVEVTDAGPGIPEEEQPRLFDRFYRGSVGGQGSGLGLAIARAIVEAHGGEIGVRSAPGEGTSFWFTLRAE